jgi:outer membrane lipoprotein-sorting protein
MKFWLNKKFFYLLAIWFWSYSGAAVPPSADSAQMHGEGVKIQNYLNGIRTLQAGFTQKNPDGTLSTGRFYLKRSGKESFGKLRLEYAPPSSLTIIANGEVLRQEDRTTGEISEYSIESTPASFLLEHKIDFSKDFDIKKIDFKRENLELTLTRAGDDSVILTLIFKTAPLLRLEGWKIIDAQANETHVNLKTVEIGMALNEKLFSFQE